MTTYLGKSCSFSLPRVHFVNCGQFMYLVISLLVLRAGCGIRLYQFLIIAYLFTLFWKVKVKISSNDNVMQANPDKFQVTMLGKIAFEKCKSSIVGGTQIKYEESVKLLGVTIDYLMNFDTHISNVCKKSS